MLSPRLLSSLYRISMDLACYTCTTIFLVGSRSCLTFMSSLRPMSCIPILYISLRHPIKFCLANCTVVLYHYVTS